MSECALPPHLKNRRHNDWPWPFSKIKRSSNAKGPRCNSADPDYLPWPPKLFKGHGIARWETAGGSSIIYIPQLENKTVRWQDVYGKDWSAIEMNPEADDYLQEKVISLIDPVIAFATVKDVPKKGEPGMTIAQVKPDLYSPSALQKFSKSGHMTLKPHYYSWWKVLKMKELPAILEGKDTKDISDTVMFYRSGWRPDHGDVYYNGDGILPIGYIGLKWE